jgi:hypothetical protein
MPSASDRDAVAGISVSDQQQLMGALTHIRGNLNNLAAEQKEPA